MPTYRFGTWISTPALVVAGALWIAFIFLPSRRYLIFIAMVVPALMLLAGALLARCKACGKSAFRYEILSPDSFLGAAFNPLRPTPEKTCSRCLADLTIQN